MLGSATAETNLQTLRLPCYLQLFGVDVGERDCGDESADAAVTVLFAAVGGRCWGARLRRRICGRCGYHAICSCWGYMLGSETVETNLRTVLLPCYYTNLRTLLLPCYLQLLGVDVGERDCGDESADASVTMLFAAEGRCCCYHAICSCWG